ncbi:MAG: hypothetical protein LAP87_17930 [Acidobacteriia bacterium]|nr:hypothetical protein [Terriglobia bacterium]
MVLRSIAVLAAVVVLPAAGQNQKRIGEIQTLAGCWSRQTQVLKQRDTVYLKDEIKYCGVPLKKTDRIVIRFDRTTTPYDRPYECAVAGICDGGAPLWLEGANSVPDPPPGGPLLSAPPATASVGSHDEVIVQGGSATWATLHIGSIHFCLYVDGKAGACNDDVRSLAPGLYGIYRKNGPAGGLSGFGLGRRYEGSGEAGSILGLVGVAARDSMVLAKWDVIPEPYKKDQSPATVRERRAYLLKLFKSDAAGEASRKQEEPQ